MSDAGNRPILVIGLGCQRGCPASVLQGLIEVCLLEHGVSVRDISALASIDSKSNETGLLELAEHMRLPLMFFSADELKIVESQLRHRSPTAFAHTGCHGVAESAALVMASRLSNGSASLLIERRNSSRATFALAIGITA